ncbi:hypothetical protein BAUCODRAFT_38851 [Baudoinia panamericana UAMH 10762]|uniref:Mid2 domain-containing protein n=1 Tax=Baudoinia panamericana (strain UAMH 10762) TaxID=717646 RepID=M2MYJ3_BAUPA|nr:uncharacterized protein BAUCODRAFT_38851 [Baudoinia panamericana UAMH 10762]EMC91729.1 hypothetical protein BAUCODRAFT_38851 [Baudoinia panamericana UAMH 10762]
MATPRMSCPSGGSFYACNGGSNFVGCCLNDPCTNGCSAGSLVSTSFDPSQFGEIPDQACGVGQSTSFFTCIYASQNNATFWGCCSANPCAAGSCPSSNLVGTVLNSNPALAAPFLMLNSSYATTASSSGTTAFATSTGNATASIVPASSEAQDSSTDVGAIAGGVVAGVVVLTALLLLLIFILRRRRKVATGPNANPHPPVEMRDSSQKGAADPYLSATKSPAFSSWTAGSTARPYSPGPPSYGGPQGYNPDGTYQQDVFAKHVSYELPGEHGQAELPSNERFQHGKPGTGLGIVAEDRQ